MFHVTVHPKRFAERLKAIAGFAARRSTCRALETVLFSVSEDGAATLRATNLEADVRIALPLASMEEPGSVLLVSDKVLKVIGNAQGPPIRVQETAPDKAPTTNDPNVATRRVSVATSRGEVAFPTYRPEDFPDLVERDPENVVELPAWRLDRLIERTGFATDPDGARSALGGRAFEFDGPGPDVAEPKTGRLSLIATDGRRLAHAHAPARGTGLSPSTQLGDGPERSLAPAIPSEALKRLRSVFATLENPNRPVRLGWTDDGRLQVRTEGLLFTARPLAGRFPSWRAIVPPPSPHRTMITDGVRLKRALKEAKGLLPKGHRRVRLRLVRNVLFIEVDVEDVASSAQVLTLRRDMPPELPEVSIDFDPDDLLDWLSVVPAFELVFPAEPKGPAVMRAEGVDYYVMPVEPTGPQATPGPTEPVADEGASEEKPRRTTERPGRPDRNRPRLRPGQTRAFARDRASSGFPTCSRRLAMSENTNDRAEAPAETKRPPRGVRPASEVLSENEARKGPPRERPNRPVRVIRLGRVRAAVWVNQTDNGPVYNTTFERLYKPDGEDQWKSSESFGTNELLLLAKVADMAHTWIHQHRGPSDSY